jgi:hypothetical protein
MFSQEKIRILDRVSRFRLERMELERAKKKPLSTDRGLS